MSALRRRHWAGIASSVIGVVTVADCAGLYEVSQRLGGIRLAGDSAGKPRRCDDGKHDHLALAVQHGGLRVMDAFARTLRDRLEPGGLVEGWVGVVWETMQPSAVGVWGRK